MAVRAARQVVAGAAPRLHQLQLEAETLRHGAQEEELELEAALPALQAQEEELRRAALARRTEVALGQELRDNDSAFVKQWMERVTTMDLFTGPFMVNKVRPVAATDTRATAFIINGAPAMNHTPFYLT